MERGAYFDFIEVYQGIYAAIVHDGLGALGNSGIIDFGEQVLVFDTTQSLVAAKELRDAAKSFTGKDVSLVVNSHCHNDHVFGNQVFADATIVGTHKTRTLMAERMPAFLKFAEVHPEYPIQLRGRLSDESLSEEARWELERDVGDIEHFAYHLAEYKVTLPTLCFESDLYLYGTHTQGQLLTYGSGHSPSDLLLFLPQEKILFIGDLASVGYHPAMKDGNPRQWTAILDQVLQLDFSILVTGHGPVGNRSHVEQTKQYLAELMSMAESGTVYEERDAIPFPYNEWCGKGIYFANVKFLRERVADHKPD